MKRTIGLGGVLALGATVLLAAPAQAEDAKVLYIPGDVNFSETRTTGHYEVVATGLHISTEGYESTDKVAGYVATTTPLSGVGEPRLEYANTAGAVPGFQLVVDFDGKGTADGILVGEPATYGDDWWASNGSADFVKKAAPSHEGGAGSENHGTLEQWVAKFPDAKVTAFGFSLGSGMKGDGVLEAINFADTRYTFAEKVILASKDECKDGGWATSTHPTYRNQGECVSYFAKQTPKQLAKLK